ncbi:beta-ketoacyl synthase [Aspergillus minisclerotigenes]|uniref:Beta-ketoacyl synthase n=1 Tax=Aspergillus minisclerotigenes TaxID=656917 RepID=A0A5N6JBI4_9EURO|nr:beta-ketoacyl synthase [Aspergillus minisclerotigenes]
MSPALEPLAITGMSLKFPGDAVSPESFWKLITEGQMTMRDYPPDRSNIDAFYHPDRDRLDQISTRGANFLNQDITRFDASFFSINAAEAEAMDPQQRLILETVYHAFENAGMTLSQASGSKTCVYTGSFSHDYTFMQVKDPMTLPKFHSTGTGMNMLSNRVSWFFNLTGPSATVDTSCSSSLIALDLACQSIWSGDSSMGVAIGSNAIIGLDTSLPLDNLSLLSNESRSYSFDQRGNGYAHTYNKADLDLSLTRYVEAHGTVMFKVSLFEQEQQWEILLKPRQSDLFSETIGLLRILYISLEKGIIPQNTDFQQLNPRIDDAYLRIKVADKQVPWPTNGLRRASVNDAYHSLLVSHFQANHNTTVYTSKGLPKEETASSRLFVLSSTDEDGFSRLKDVWRSFFSSLEIATTEKQRFLNNLAYTLSLRRTHHSWRTFAVVHPNDDWSHIVDGLVGPQQMIASPNLAFIFTGQGAQWYAMGRELLDAYPVFRDSIQKAGSYIQTLGCQWDLMEELQKPELESNVNNTEYSQMLCTALQIALVDLLHHVGIVPEAVVGHSSGEIAAAYCAHAITRESAWKIAFYRGLWTRKLEMFSSINGAMLAVALSRQAIAPFLERTSTHYPVSRLTIACKNSPQSTTVSGEEQQIDTLEEYLEQEHIFCRRLKVKVAYHSLQMSEITTQYHQEIGQVEGTNHKGKRPNILSSVTGTWISHSEMQSASYWVQNLVSTVNFSDALTTLCSNTTDVTIKKLDGSHRQSLRMHHLLEVGPHSVLQGPVKDIQKIIEGPAAVYHPVLVRGVSALETFLQAAGHLYAAGYPTNLSHVNRCTIEQERPMCLPCLPEYPFNHKAAKQLASPGRVISGFKLEDISLLASIRIPQGEGGVETSLYMRPDDSMENKYSHLFSFKLCTYVNDCWAENCLGRIHILYQPDEPDPVNGDRVEREDLADSLYSFSKAPDGCGSTVYSDVIYDHMARCGFEYGKTFRQIHALAVGGKGEREVIGDVNNFKVSMQDTIHPTTLDGIIQTMTHTVTETSETGTLLTSIRAFDRDLREVMVSIEGLKFTAITSKAPTENTSPVKDNVCHRFECKPDINLLSNDEIHTVCRGAYPDLAIPKDFLIELDFLVMVRITETLQVISQRDIEPQKPHLKKYIDWMRHHQERLLGGELMFSAEPWKSRFSDTKFIQGLESRVMRKGKQGELLVRVTRHLVEFLNNELDPLAFLYQENLARDFYAEMVRLILSNGGIFARLQVLGKMKILEVGAGTGCATAALLRILGKSYEHKSMSPKYAHWEYTDISRSFFDEAAKQFASEGSRIAFRTLDIEEDPADQGFEYATFDLLLACVSCYFRFSQNTDPCPKTAEALILVELTNASAIRAAGVFGLLDGWWLEPYRFLGPSVDESQWNSLLLQAGYTGCEIFFPDYDDRTCHETAVIISTATQNPSQLTYDQPIDIVYEPNDLAQLDLGRTLARHYTTQTNLARLIRIQDATPDSKATLRVFLLEYQKPVLYDIGEDIYNRLQPLLLSADPMLWVTNGGGKQPSQPKSHLIDGLLRVLPEEDGNRSRYILALDPTETPKLPHFETIAKLSQRILSATESIDTEYIESNGLLHIPRLTVDPVLIKAIYEREQVAAEKKQKFGSGPSLKLDVYSQCMLNGFKFIEDYAVQQPLGPNEIEIQNRSVGINFRDLLVSLGQLESNDAGLECAGVVVRVGDSCRRIKVGDRVAALYPTAFSTYIRLPETGPVAIIPAGMSYTDAASIPVSFVTSYIALRQAASLQVGESILIHSGAGGTGQAAIQIAQYVGAEIYTTVGSESKKQLIMEVYGIPEDHIFSSRSTGFAKAVMRRTRGKGVNVVLNSLSGEAMLASWECIATYGRFIEIGKRDIMSNNNLPLGMFLRNTMFRGFDLGGMMMDRPDLCLSALDDILSLMSDGTLRPVQPITTYGIGDIEAAFRFMQTGKHQGKLVIDVGMEDMVTTVMNTKPNFTCDGNATYVIAGGLGGIGQSIAAWLVDRGAQTLLLLSRSGAKGPEAMKFINSLQTKDARAIAPACDICNESALRKVLEEWQPQLPPIKGCIQAAMVLRDRGMEFFILLSSISGIIGTHGQANYAAGNTFQDALARYRVKIGESAASLDLGLIIYTGAVANNPKLLPRWQSNSVSTPITESELKALVDCYCSPLHGYELDCQPSIGVQPEVRERANWPEKPLFKCMTLNGAHSQDLPSREQTFQLAAAMENARSKLSSALALDEKDIDADKHLSKYGVDSLVAVELRTWFATELKANIAIFDIIGSTVATIAQLAASRSKLQKGYST